MQGVCDEIDRQGYALRWDTMLGGVEDVDQQSGNASGARICFDDSMHKDSVLVRIGSAGGVD